MERKSIFSIKKWFFENFFLVQMNDIFWVFGPRSIWFCICSKNADQDTGAKKMWNHNDPTPDSQPCYHRIYSNEYCLIIGMKSVKQIKWPLYPLLLFVSEFSSLSCKVLCTHFAARAEWTPKVSLSPHV